MALASRAFFPLRFFFGFVLLGFFPRSFVLYAYFFKLIDQACGRRAADDARTSGAVGEGTGRGDRSGCSGLPTSGT